MVPAFYLLPHAFACQLSYSPLHILVKFHFAAFRFTAFRFTACAEKIRAEKKSAEKKCAEQKGAERIVRPEYLQLPGYTLVSRRDRVGQKGGGIALFVQNSFSSSVVLLETSLVDERCWHIIHTTQGPYLLGVWYRPPQQGETDSIQRMEEEYVKHCSNVLGTILVGDLNIHHKNWLQHSRSVTPEGRLLYDFCLTSGFEERVKQPTREKNLLDLVLTDLHTDVKCEVRPQLADHNCVLVTTELGVPSVVEVERECWQWHKADWSNLRKELADTNWDQVLFVGEEPFEDLPNAAVQRFTDLVLNTARKHVPVTTRVAQKQTHPWLNERCRNLVAEAQAAQGTHQHGDKLKQCSQGVFQEYLAYVEQTKKKLKKFPRASRAWWKLTKHLQNKAEKTSNVPPLKQPDGTWAQTPEEKAELFADTFAKKFILPPEAAHPELTLPEVGGPVLGNFLPVRVRTAKQVLKALNEDKATGPDGFSARLLHKCADALARPVTLIARLLLSTGVWPSSWRLHWVFPFYKKKSVYDASNYRGIHLSSQLSKVIERLLGKLFLPFLEIAGAYRHNQWAYRKGRGAKDALAINVIQWVWWLHNRYKVGL